METVHWDKCEGENNGYSYREIIETNNRKGNMVDDKLTDHQPTVCPCSQEEQWYPGVHEECGLQVAGGNPPCLLHPCRGKGSKTEDLAERREQFCAK